MANRGITRRNLGRWVHSYGFGYCGQYWPIGYGRPRGNRCHHRSNKTKRIHRKGCDR